MRKSLAIRAAVIALALGLATRLFLPGIVEGLLNGVYPETTKKPISERATKLHARLFIADLHADPLLWGRNLRNRSTRGHIDFPRMREGGLALETFSVVSKTPRHLNIERNDDKTDDIFWLGLVGGWPLSTLTSLKDRTLYLASRLPEYAGDPTTGLRLIRTKRDLSAFLDARAKDSLALGGILSIEGLHALEGNLDNIDAIDKAGFRLVGLAHFFDNEVAGSAHGIAKGGLTPFGRKVIPLLEQRQILVDLAHSSAKTIDDVLAIAKRPVVVSHTGVKATCDNSRNLTDAQLAAVAATGGVIGIGFWKEASCGYDVGGIAKSIVHAIRIAGKDHVGLGSDFDGSTYTPFDSTGLIELTQALLDSDLDEATIEAVMGGNVRRLYATGLPD